MEGILGQPDLEEVLHSPGVENVLSVHVSGFVLSFVLSSKFQPSDQRFIWTVSVYSSVL